MKPFALPLACVCIVATAFSVHAGVIAMPPAGPARVAKADAVIVGRVESLEPQDVKAGTITYRIAIVRIQEGLRGVKTEKMLRVGFIPVEKPKPMVIVTGARPVQLQVGQEGLFILNKQAKEDFYTIGGVVGYLINRENNAGFDKEVQAAKSAVKVMENPQAALKAKDADERLLAAAVLIEDYRTYRGPKAKLEPISAEESKLILQVLADADWQAPWNFSSLRPNPGQLFQRLGVTAKDGFMPPPNTNYQTAAQNWLREHAQKYRIERYVVSESK